MGEKDVGHVLKLFVYQMNQDDPKKCTSNKLCRLRLVKPLFRISRLPKKRVLLNPYAEELLLAKDRDLILRGGLAIIDCSWKKAKETFVKTIRGTHRKLPTLIAANPINYGHAHYLSSAEALAAALYVVSLKKEAKKLLNAFKWGPAFLSLNKNLLEDYGVADTEADIREIEKSYFSPKRE